MKRLFGVVVLSMLIVLMGSFYVSAEDCCGEECSMEQLENLGDDEYMADSGEIVQMEDIGGGDEMTDSGEIYQNYGSEDGDLVTSSGDLVQIDE